MERVNDKEDQRSKVNRIISYVIIFVSAIMLAFCISQIVRYISYVNKNAALTTNLEELKQDSNYLRDHFSVLRDDEYYSVYIDSEYQYVDSQTDSVEIIK